VVYVITDECVGCGICAEYCPISAIEEGDRQYAITGACIQCGACVKICPVQAIIKKIK
jgi:ferredoxin